MVDRTTSSTVDQLEREKRRRPNRAGRNTSRPVMTKVSEHGSRGFELRDGGGGGLVLDRPLPSCLNWRCTSLSPATAPGGGSDDRLKRLYSE